MYIPLEVLNLVCSEIAFFSALDICKVCPFVKKKTKKCPFLIAGRPDGYEQRWYYFVSGTPSVWSFWLHSVVDCLPMGEEFLAYPIGS
jgi:hypothetical protein